MALLPKIDLLRTVKYVASFDNTASPYVGVQIGDIPTFYRSGSTGFIQSLALGVGKITYVSLSHLRDCLNVLKDDSVSLELDPNGVVCLSSTDNVYDSELRIHTVRSDQAGVKYHDVGTPTIKLNASMFQGFDARPFTCAAAPSLVDGRLTLPTTNGIVLWTGPAELKPVTLQPRESFLKFLGSALNEICVTDNGYWGAASSDLMSFISGHTGGQHLYHTYSVATTPIGNLPSTRLLYALSAASNLCADNGKIEVCPTQGVLTRDTTGNQAKFALGPHTGWTKFAIAAKSAKLIIAALSQAKEDNIVLSQVPLSQPTVRLAAGAWECNTRTF